VRLDQWLFKAEKLKALAAPWSSNQEQAQDRLVTLQSPPHFRPRKKVRQDACRWHRGTQQAQALVVQFQSHLDQLMLEHLAAWS